MSRRRREEEDAVTIRKNKRSHRIYDKPLRDPGKPFMTLDAIIRGVRSDDHALQLETTTRFKNILSQGYKSPIEVAVHYRLVPCFAEFLGRHDEPELQFQAAWALTNIASSDHAPLLIDLGTVPLFVQFLSSGSSDLAEQAVWALGNIAADSPSCRDIVLDHGALLPLLPLLNTDTEISKLRIATWALSNFCHGKQPPVDFEQVKPALPVLRQLIYLTDTEILTDVCRALSYLSDGPIEKVQAVIEQGVCPRLVELLLHISDEVTIPAIRTLGNVVAGNDALAQLVIDNQVLPRLFRLLTQNRNKIILKEVCWTISNITAGNRTQKQAFIEANLIFPLIHLLDFGEFDIKKEAAWAISNATSAGSHEQIKILAIQGCIQPLCDLLGCPDPKIVTCCLEGLENILFVGEAYKKTEGVNIFAQMVHDCGGQEKIEFLQTHESTEIFERSMMILERFWKAEYAMGNLNDLLNSLQRFHIRNNQPDLPSGSGS
ncbi:hypothetical protein VNO77_18263 [Canavalia gladiata]|uniref:Importin subunit alpha n=1 Tax=Canavalia gladiata TaxID=3824 RepID=A0AAN9LP36_CANGL